MHCCEYMLMQFNSVLWLLILSAVIFDSTYRVYIAMPKKADNQQFSDFQPLKSGVGRDRTGDTRIFSPLLYRLSYRTIPIWGSKNRSNC